jgi:hypothetical protein
MCGAKYPHLTSTAFAAQLPLFGADDGPRAAQPNNRPEASSALVAPPDDCLAQVD